MVNIITPELKELSTWLSWYFDKFVYFKIIWASSSQVKMYKFVSIF